MGNVKSIANAFELLGETTKITDDIEDIFSELINLFETYDETGCLTDASAQNFCPTVLHPENSAKWMN